MRLDWRSAPCYKTFDNRFFGTPDEQREARRLYCLSCPLITECLSLAEATNERTGLWGGRTQKDRRMVG